MNLSRIYGLPPIENSTATILILGSMPGQASLQAHAYYAHPQNAFWKIMGELIGASPQHPYAERIQRLQSSHIALWDVVGSCLRRGSLDADIDESSIVANDFADFYLKHVHIRQVFFNGAKAELAYKKYVLMPLSPLPLNSDAKTYCRLPSSSPAHAGMGYAQKLEAWRAIMRQP